MTFATVSKLAINNPSATTIAPIPVEIKARRNNFNAPVEAVVAVVLAIVAPVCAPIAVVCALVATVP